VGLCLFIHSYGDRAGWGRWGSASPRGGGDGGRRGGEGSAGAPSLVANPESGEGWAAPGCLGADPGSEIPPPSVIEGKWGGLKSVTEQMTEGFGGNDDEKLWEGSEEVAGGEGGLE